MEDEENIGKEGPLKIKGKKSQKNKKVGAEKRQIQEDRVRKRKEKRKERWDRESKENKT